MVARKLKVVVLTGDDSAATCLAISHLLSLGSVQIVAILLDVRVQRFGSRIRNLLTNIRREGVSYLWHRAVEGMSGIAERLAARVVSSEEVRQTLRKAFPDHAFTLSDFEQLHGVPLLQTPNLNSPQAGKVLAGLQADLGVVLGTRILKRHTFSIPRMGCVNLHKGKVPEYRGLPPGFWELYDGQKSAGVTVHFVDDGLDTGDILGEASVEIHPKDTPETLRRKLDHLGSEVLAESISGLAAGSGVGHPQAKSTIKPHRAPTRAQRKELNQRLGLDRAQQPELLCFLKTVLYLAFFYSGAYLVVRTLRRWLQPGRVSVLLYHRVNDMTRDVLTTDVERFAEHMVAVRDNYDVVTTESFVTKLRRGELIGEDAVAIHFDDCYRDVATKAQPVLKQLQVPACAFVSSGFIDTDRIFPHDDGKCPVRLENLLTKDLASWVKEGFEVGSHTVNHVDLGQCTDETARVELTESKQDLERLLKHPVSLFSFPYGRKNNFRPEVTELAKQTGYKAIFSAYGGRVNQNADLYDLRRIGVGGQFRALDLLMELEGLSPGGWKRKIWRDAQQ